MREDAARILVVDDDLNNRDLLSRRLGLKGYAVEAVASGPEALARLEAQPVDLILLDVQMPGMNGFEVLRRIRAQHSPVALPVLMVTAKDQSGDVVEALGLGANDYITKPIDFPVAVARVHTHLERKRAEDRLRESEERYALAAAGTNDGLWDWKLDTNEIFLSSRWKAILGYGDDEVGNQVSEWFSRVHPEDLPGLKRDMDAHLAGRAPHLENEHRVRHKSGCFRWVLTRGLAVRNAAGAAVRIAGSQSDITEAKVVDPLTGLPNRLLLNDRLERVLYHQRSHPNAQCALLFLDLDDFKVVNDSLGHQAGDALLRDVAARLEESLRASDMVARPSRETVDRPEPTEHTLARLGGDEFIVLLDEVRSVIDANWVAERLQESLARPFSVLGHTVFVTVSIGLALSGPDRRHSEELLRDADTAMYRAKATGKGRCEVFDANMRVQVLDRLQLDSALRQAVARDEFVPYFQPIVDLSTGALAGFEALLRWRHPSRGIVLPADFVPIIEENGLVVPVGRRFLEQVCQLVRTWQDAFPQAARLAININFASQQFVDRALTQRMLEELNKWRLAPDHIVVELTERTAIRNFGLTGEVLGHLRAAGFRVVVDDFGTGYSSLACLHQLPISGLKLDRAFVAAARRQPAPIRAVLALASSLDLTVTAEGIEEASERRALQSMGCHLGQGFLFGEPADAGRTTEIIAAKPVWHSGVQPAAPDGAARDESAAVLAAAGPAWAPVPVPPRERRRTRRPATG